MYFPIKEKTVPEDILNLLLSGDVNNWNEWYEEKAKKRRYDTFVDIREINLSNLDLSGINLEYAFLRDSMFRNTNLSNAKLSFARFTNSDMRTSKIKNSNLHEVESNIFCKFSVSLFFGIS